MSIWVSEHVSSAAAINNVGACYEMEGALEPSLVERALKVLFQSHENLRVAFVEQRGVVRRAVANDPVIPLRYEDLSMLDAEAYALSLDRFIGDCMAHRFELDRPPLLRMLLVKRSEIQWTLVVVAHHLIVDAPSLAIFIRELGRIYGLLAADAQALTTPQPSRFADPAARRIAPAVMTNAGHFVARLEGASPVLGLPRHAVRPDPRSYACRTLAVSFGAETADMLARFGGANALTQFEVLLGAIGIAVARMANRSDAVIGIPVLLREGSADTEIGCFINLLPFRFSMDGAIGFGETARRTASAIRSDLQYRFTPLHQILAATATERDPGRHPLVQIVFTVREGPLPVLQLGPSRGRGRLLARSASLFDLSIDVLAEADDLTVTAEYRSASFSESDVRELLAAFKTCLTAGCTDPHEPIKSLRLMSEAAWRTAAHADEARFGPPPEYLSYLLSPDRPAQRASVAVTAGDLRLTYQELDRQIRALADRLCEACVQPGDRVAVLLERRLELPAALLSVLRVGAAFVPIDPTFPLSAVSAILDDARPQIVLTSPRTRALFADVLANFATLDATASPEALTIPKPNSGVIHDDALSAYVIYTSGSTGRPKGVDISRRSLANLLSSIGGKLLFSHDSIMLSATTISFDIAALEIFLPVAFGGQLILAESSAARDPWALVELLRFRHPTHFQATPSLFKLLIDSCGWEGSPTLTLLCGGEQLPSTLALALRSRCRHLFNLYGPTETTIWSTMGAVREAAQIDVGEPLDRTRVYILDRWNELRPPRAVGQIAIGGDGVAKGYVGLESLTQSRFVADPVDAERGRVFLTGDIGRRNSSGRIEVFGRDDDLIKIRGFRVELRAIEAVLVAQPEIKEVAAFSARSPQTDEPQLCAALVCTSQIDMPGLRYTLQDALPSYMVPHHLFKLESLPLTPSGKIDREALARTWAELCSTATASDGTATADPVLEKLARLFTRHTGKQAGIYDDLLALGGDSIAAIRLLADVRREFNVAIPVSDFLDGPRTIARLARLVGDFGSRATRGLDLLDAIVALSEQEAERELAMPPQDGGSRPDGY